VVAKMFWVVASWLLTGPSKKTTLHYNNIIMIPSYGLRWVCTEIIYNSPLRLLLIKLYEL